MKIALPKGRLLKKTAALLRRASWELDEYHEEVRFYHSRSQKFPHMLAKVFHEKDIPIQVAVGNYDLGICGSDWVEELLAKYPSSSVVKLRPLGYGECALYMTASPSQPAMVAAMKSGDGVVRIASEYPNLAESFALRHRLSLFNIFPVWGGAEAYPPEGAEMALISVAAEAELGQRGVVPVSKLLDCEAFLIANRNSWEASDLGDVVASIGDKLPAAEESRIFTGVAVAPEKIARRPAAKKDADTVRLALPDGHQQQPTLELLGKCGIDIDDYPSATGNRRPATGLEGFTVKVIRPQDMPLQMANGNFDLAITGRDWLREHLYQFPSSPVRELLDLKQGRVRLVAVVSQELPDDVPGLRQFIARRAQTFRVASEYVNIADRYARDKRLGPYRVVPTWGATEAFLPDDADLLIENTETGRTIARHNLKIVETIFESTACLIGSAEGASRPVKRERIESIVKTLRAAVEDI
ncbi:MAG: ATP phosphoribosyltransferase [Chloroflexota bacterium]